MLTHKQLIEIIINGDQTSLGSVMFILYETLKSSNSYDEFKEKLMRTCKVWMRSNPDFLKKLDRAIEEVEKE